MRRDIEALRGGLAALAVLVALSLPASADAPRQEQRPPPGATILATQDRGALARACLVAATEAEARLGLPEGILAALALTESAAHPFAIGTPRAAHYPPSRGAAERLARTAGQDAAGGCFQINLSVHAAEDMGWVFDPWASALFAGRKLVGHLEATGGDWGAALARYAGARPGTEAARLHHCRVAASQAALGRLPPPGLSTAPCRGGEARTATAKAVTITARAGGPTALAAAPR